jgi:hypothetical protein
MKKILLLILTFLSLTFAQSGLMPLAFRFWGMGFVMFIYLVLAFFLFSIIFWACYVWMVKGKEKKE